MSPVQTVTYVSGSDRRKNGRSERIRTSDPLVPNEVRYQAALHSDTLLDLQEEIHREQRGMPALRGGSFSKAHLFPQAIWRAERFFFETVNILRKIGRNPGKSARLMRAASAGPRAGAIRKAWRVTGGRGPPDVLLGKTCPGGEEIARGGSCACRTVSLYSVSTALGCSQAVRQRFLVPPCAGSNPATPASVSFPILF